MAELTIGGQSLEASFPPNSAFLISAKGRGGIKLIEGVGPNNTGIQTGCHFKDLGPFVGPNPSAETIRSIISLRKRLLRGSETLDRQHRTKDFFLNNSVALSALRKQSWLKPVPFSRDTARRLPHTRTLLFTGFHQFLNSV